jgi:hypothetical protein
MKIDGSCHCGAVRCTAQINPDKVTLCHCTDCQRRPLSRKPRSRREARHTRRTKALHQDRLERRQDCDDVLRNMRYADLFLCSRRSGVREPASGWSNPAAAAAAETAGILHLRNAMGVRYPRGPEGLISGAASWSRAFWSRRCRVDC